MAQPVSEQLELALSELGQLKLAFVAIVAKPAVAVKQAVAEQAIAAVQFAVSGPPGARMSEPSVALPVVQGYALVAVPELGLVPEFVVAPLTAIAVAMVLARGQRGHIATGIASLLWCR